MYENSFRYVESQGEALRATSKREPALLRGAPRPPRWGDQMRELAGDVLFLLGKRLKAQSTARRRAALRSP